MAERVGVSPVIEVVSAESAAQHAPQTHRPNRGVDRFLHVQQAIGNRAMQNLLAGGLLQPKLRVGPVDDVYEREADRTADRVMRMPDPDADEASPLQAPISRVQRMCAECEEERIQRMCAECEEEEGEKLRRQVQDEEEEVTAKEEDDEPLQRRATVSGAPPVDVGIESHIASLRGGGQPLSPSVRSFFEPRFNHDFSDVRLHTGATAMGAANEINARAFTIGRDIMFSAGEYAPHTSRGRRLLGHELTHIVQQTPTVARRMPLIQRLPATEPVAEAESTTVDEVGPVLEADSGADQSQSTVDSESETEVASQPVAPQSLLVENDAPATEPGQMTKSAFMEATRSAVCATADAALAGTEYTSQGCPYVELALRFYENRTAERIERDLVNYLPEAAGVASARDYIPLIAQRVQQSLAIWIETGEITGIPEGLPSIDKIAALADESVTGPGSLLFKARDGGSPGVADPRAVQAELGAGQPLAASTRAGMEAAFGRSFSNVRVHDDAAGATLSRRFNARAFSVGHDVAFDSGEYSPGTVFGDALLAHELAHVVQQERARSVDAPRQPGATQSEGLEKDADLSAIGAVASLWSGEGGAPIQIPGAVTPRLKTGLHLARCSKTESPKAAGVHYDEAVSSMSSTLNVDELKKLYPAITEYEKGSKADLLKHLEEIDVGGVWIFFGHGAFNKKDEIVGINANDKTIFGGELKAALAADKDPPTLVVIGGCTSADLLHYAREGGVPVAAGFSEKISNVLGAGATQVFVTKVLKGGTFDEAKAEANKAAQGGGLLSGAAVIVEYAPGYDGRMTLKDAQDKHKKAIGTGATP